MEEELKKALAALADTDNSISFGFKRPKTDMLVGIRDSINAMLLALFSTTDILSRLNQVNFCISDTTLLRFLKSYMHSEHEQNLKMRYFASRIVKIDTIKKDDPNISNEKLFEKLNFTGNINGKYILDLTILDFNYFMSEYFTLAHEYLVNNIENEKKSDVASIRITTDLEKDIVQKSEPIATEITVVNDVDDSKIIYKRFPHEGDDGYGELDIKDIKVDLDVIPVISLEDPIEKKAKLFKKMAETTLKNIPYSERFKYIRFATLSNPIDIKDYNHFQTESAKELRRKQGKAISMVLNDFGRFDTSFDDWDSIPDNTVVYDGDNDWKDTDLFKDLALQYFEYDKQKEIITELYLYVKELRSINLIDFNTFKLVDGQAIIVNAKRDEHPFRIGEYYLYRYFNGAFYYMNGIDSLYGWTPSFSNYLEGYGGVWLNGECRMAMNDYYIYMRDKK